MQELPKLPSGWKWRKYANPSFLYATNGRIDIGVWGDNLVVRIFGSTVPWEWKDTILDAEYPLPVLYAVLRANGVTL